MSFLSAVRCLALASLVATLSHISNRKAILSGPETAVLPFDSIVSAPAVFPLIRLVTHHSSLATDPAEAHVGRGYEYLKDERYQEAAREFQAALDLNPHLLRIRYQLAVCQFALGKWKESREQFERLRAQTGADSKVIYYLGRLDLQEGNIDAAIRQLESVVSNPPFPDTAYYLGSAYLKKDNLKAAENWLHRAATADPRDFRIPDHLARAYQKAGNRQEAEKEYAHSAELRQRFNEASRVAVACSQELETRTLDEARATCRQLFDSNDPDKLTTLGMLYGQHSRYEDALEPLERAARLDPDSSEIQHNLGLTYFRLRRYAEARALLQKAVELRPDFFGSNALLGATLYALKSDEPAYRILDHAHQLNPQDADTAGLLFKLATLLAEARCAKKEYAECLTYLRKAAALRPADAEVHRRLSNVYSSLGRPAEAARENQEAERLSGSPP